MSDPTPTDDLLDGIDAYARQLLELTEALGDLLRPWVGSVPGSKSDQGIGALQPEPTTWSTTAKVFHTVTGRPLELATTGFRLVGAGLDVVIEPTDVSFVPPVLAVGADSFEVIVERGVHANGIYEGSITAASDPATPITDLVMPAW